MRPGVRIEMACFRQDLQLLGLQGPRVCLQRQIGGREDIIGWYDHQQRGRGDMLDMLAGDVSAERFDAGG